MLKFAANISTMFGEWSFPERISVAADAGFTAVECQWPYDFNVNDLTSRLSDAGIPLVLINAPKDDGNTSGFGMAAMPGQETAFQRSIDRASEYAIRLSGASIHVLAGVPDDEADFTHCRDTYVNNIQWAADQLKLHDISILLESINVQDVPNYHIRSIKDIGAAIVTIDRDNVGMQFDAYHAYRQGENICDVLSQWRHIIEHVQISGHPGRHEPIDGDINFSAIFRTLEAANYAGWIGCEYRPAGGTLEGLSWLQAYEGGAR